jgi:hypothetical protein
MSKLLPESLLQRIDVRFLWFDFYDDVTSDRLDRGGCARRLVISPLLLRAGGLALVR